MNISGVGSIATQPVFAPAAGGEKAPAAGPKVNFGQAIRDAVQTVDEAQQTSTASVQDLLAGRQQDVLPVVAAVAKADVSFKLLIGVRNKMIEAYKQTMNMPI